MELNESQKAIKTMLVDDSIINHYIIKNLFRKQGFTKEVACFENAEDALAQLSNCNEHALPDIILLDINMPGMNGFDFLDAFIELSETIKKRCRIVMLSSSMDVADIERATANPYVKLYLHKPLSKHDVGMLLSVM
jgi:CheY-like chemotaxis protein